MESEDLKTCPKCGALLFSDMDMCFECLHSFGEGSIWTDEKVPLEVYPEQSIDETCAEPMRTWWLRVCSDLVDVEVPVPQSGLLIGRGQTSDIVLHARSVSRRHVRLEPIRDGLIVHDVGARNAAMLNGEKLTRESCMHEGDVLGVCGTRFMLVPERRQACDDDDGSDAGRETLR